MSRARVLFYACTETYDVDKFKIECIVHVEFLLERMKPQMRPQLILGCLIDRFSCANDNTEFL